MKKYKIAILLSLFSSIVFAKNNTYSEPPFDVHISNENYYGNSAIPDFRYYGKVIWKINVTSHINGLVVQSIDLGDFGRRFCNGNLVKSGNLGRKMAKGRTLSFKTCVSDYGPGSFVIKTNKGTWQIN
ncbi:hypothetical protein ACWIYZ_01830 [Ursidibacter arcticus]